MFKFRSVQDTPLTAKDYDDNLLMSIALNTMVKTSLNQSSLLYSYCSFFVSYIVDNNVFLFFRDNIYLTTVKLDNFYGFRFEFNKITNEFTIIHGVFESYEFLYSSILVSKIITLDNYESLVIFNEECSLNVSYDSELDRINLNFSVGD